MKHFVISILMFTVWWQVKAATLVTTADPVKIEVDNSQPLYSLEPELFGVCPMFWSESDKDMADNIIETRLKEMNCRFLRFPGGTESDNFDWRTNLLVDQRRWPFKDGLDKMTTDKFITLCRRLNAEPIICVNTELAFFENDSAAVKLAAEWVKYCNLEKKYGIRYWEIGNEPYYHARFNATEYAELLVKMSRAMKAVDPTILVAAVGEWNPDYIGVKEEISSENLKQAQELELISEMGKWEVAKKFHALRTEKTSLKWWNEVMRIASNNIDVASIHWYYSVDELSTMTETLQKLNVILNPANSSKKVELIMTEWSLHENIEMYGFKRALTVGEAIGRMSDGLVKKANYWPLRCGGSHDKKGLLDMTPKKKAHANFYVMKLWANNIGDKRIISKSSSDKLYHYATQRGDEIQLFIINRTDNDIATQISVKDGKKYHITMEGLQADSKNIESDDVEHIVDNLLYRDKINIVVPQNSIMVYKLKRP